MRKLVFKDVIAVARIIKKGNLRQELSNITDKFSKDNADLEKAGIEAMLTILETVGDEKLEKEIYMLLSDIFEKDVENMSLESVVENFKQLANENNLIGFFKQASL